MTDAPAALAETPADAPSPPAAPQPPSTPPVAPSVTASSPTAASDRDADAPPGSGRSPAANLDLLSGVEIEVAVELGRRRMSLGEVSRLAVGSVVELDTLAGEPLVLYANGRRIATGEAVVVDGQFGVRIQSLGAG